jgi:hypothetical protein
MQFPVRDKLCPMCHAPITVATVELHPTRPDIVHHNFECVNCGPVGTTIISLRPKENAQPAH